MAQEFTIVIERDEDDYLVASVPSIHGCHTQARTMDELLERIKEAIQLCPEARGEDAGDQLGLAQQLAKLFHGQAGEVEDAPQCATRNLTFRQRDHRNVRPFLGPFDQSLV